MTPSTKAGRALWAFWGNRSPHLPTPAQALEAILAIEEQALPSPDLLARAIEAVAQRPGSAMGSRAQAEAILEWLRGQG